MSATSGQASGLKVRRFHAEAGARIWLSGVIDEHFPPDAFDAAHGVVVIDLGGITRITSFGIREWCQNLMGIDAPALYFANVASCVVPQFAMVQGFFGQGGQILSYQGIYECEHCGATTTRTFDRRRDPDDAWAAGAPETMCDACKKPMTFSDITESHRIALTFGGPLREHAGLTAVASAGETPSANAAPAAPAPPRSRATASHGAIAWTYPFEVKKQVVGKATLLWLSGTLDSVAGFRHVADGLEGEVVLIAPGIIACDDAGVEVLRRSITAAIEAGGHVWLSRCSPVLVAALARHPEVLGARAPVTSVEHGLACERCGIDVPYFSTCNAAGERGVFCCRCRSACPPPNQALDAALAKLTCAAAPEWLPALVAVPPAARSPVVAKQPAPRWLWPLVAVGIVAALVAGAGIYSIMHPTRRRPLAAYTPEAAVEEPSTGEPAPEEPAPIAAAPGTPAPARPRKPRPAVAVAGAAVPVTPAPAAPRSIDDVIRLRKLSADKPPELDDDAPTLPKQLTTEQINASMAALKDAAKDCYLEFHQKGTVFVKGVVSPNGRLQSVEAGGVLADTPSAACVQKAARHATFPHFNGAPIPVTYPYELR